MRIAWKSLNSQKEMNANPEAEIQKQREKTRTSRGWGVNLKDQEVGLWDVLRRRATSGVGAEGGWLGGKPLAFKGGSPVHLQPCQGWGRGVPSVSLSSKVSANRTKELKNTLAI